ncbi:unnamed protein product [Caenorhabditis bovis]|uniref:Midasin n=1 Tax=Caenorhabditis bovis TaxID=2654633 RepID=A0A8S1EZ00_9PELO|nr:unnamed protein product [Caenorhabditis bovis]
MTESTQERSSKEEKQLKIINAIYSSSNRDLPPDVQLGKMVNKSKERRKARKRLLSNSKTNEDLEVIEVSLQKKRLLEDEPQKEIIMNDESCTILPTREILGQQVVTAVRNKKFAIIEGPLGCGKTFLASYAANSLNLPLNVMQMGDQIDSKTLFGSYYCTEVAGQFHWNESTFSKWLRTPCVILLEDIDAANADVITKIIEIASSRKTDASDEEKNCVFHESVRILATMSGKGKRNAVLDGVPIRIKVGPLSDEELKRLASKAFPRISHLSRTLISIFRTMEAIPGNGNSRQLTSADFLRGCSRLSKLADVSANVEAFAELIDVWCLADTKDRSMEMCNKVAAMLNVHPDRVHTHMSVRQPDVNYDDKVVSIGRAILPREQSMIKSARHRLGHTRDVVQLMERIAVCVSNNEPLLLVGETGVGKTSVVQAVADLIGTTLNVVNVSPTSDSDELIQGYKPTTIGQLIEPFTKFYVDVFSANFDVSKNRKFFDNLEKCLSSGRFRDYLNIVEATAIKAFEKKKNGQIDERWAEILVRAKQIRVGLEKGAAPFALQKGAVLEAADNGHWLLVDEINLAPPECLDAIIHALSAASTHPNFRLFACMNPATDSGKRRLPPSVRTKFTEFFVSETHDPHQLALIVSAYLPTIQQNHVDNLVKFYLQAKQMYPSTYSLRTFCRALLFVTDNMFGSVEQSIYEAVSMAYLTNLEDDEKNVMRSKIQTMFKCSHAAMPSPKNVENFVKIGGYLIEKGDVHPADDAKYVITKTVKANLAEISRIVCSGRFPILLEGETSAGKTSIVCYLGKITGNRIVRINNHEHTDVQEYMGSYVADNGGRLVFREGALVQAVRNGSWVILDELNLAPTDVIEALNRLLDDNRELFVPEINETIKAHPRFRLFATQNPAGTYAGRKKLSRALMSRFIVLRFNHLPMDELSEMVCTRCDVPPSAAHKMIEVLNELRTRRSLSGLFSARDGLMTLRDVFRWAKRLTTDETCDDWLQILVNHGYFLLAGRCRNKKDEETVVETLQKVIKRNIDVEKLFDMESPYMPTDVNTGNVVLTLGMRRMLVLTHQAWLRNEAVLLVGETGGGKTTLSELVGRGKLRSINCHERTETVDLLGRLRPKQNGGFEWSDGVVIAAMRDGVPLLVDEISLAEDSVLERLNPLFEEDRSLLLSDAGTETELITALPGFQIVATMNPGGDYGKKELSKALRNRFTEVWTSSDYTPSELMAIFDQRLLGNEATADEALIFPSKTSKAVVAWIIDFFSKYSHVFRHAPSVRDIVACAELYSAAIRAGIESIVAIRDALCAVFLDSLAGLTTRLQINPSEVFDDALSMVPYGPLDPKLPKSFSLKAPTCAKNFYRIARGLLINKPILLEGAPGCGKSSTVMALAQLTGNPITRLNLSDQTDLSDLFGSDVPVITEDGAMSFRWEDGPVLKAIKNGEWVLLDEMNLASQSVLEGLNACFDHRRILYIAELNKSFEIPTTSSCRFFACQNPRVQGGNRRALPKSFVNRFTNIYTDDLSKNDIEIVLKGVDSSNLLTKEVRTMMVEINQRCIEEAEAAKFAGGPHSFNLRDLLRWYELAAKYKSLSEAYEVVYVSRMRSSEDRELMRTIFRGFSGSYSVYPAVQLTIDERVLRIGKSKISRRSSPTMAQNENRLLPSQMEVCSNLATCVEMNWLVLLVGPRNCGKRSAIENLATLSGRTLRTIALNADTDAQELIGSYEQIVDENCLPDAKEAILKVLHDAELRSMYAEKLRGAEDLTQLESSVELILSEISNDDVKAKIRHINEIANQASMRFEWRDSVFVDAYLNGYWLLVEDVNLCSAAVLDRLNSCLESGGKLVVAERQNSYEPLEPHPEFRVFLSMDSRVGEISRAMRNRSVEIYVDETSRWHTSTRDVSSVICRSLNEHQADYIASNLSPEQQLHLSILLSDENRLPLPSLLKLVGAPEIENFDDGNETIEGLIAPNVQCVANLNGNYEEWLIENWKVAIKTRKISMVEGVFMVLSSATPQILNSNNLIDAFGRKLIEPFIYRLKHLNLAGRHLIDPRFAGGFLKNEMAVKKYNTMVLFEWMLQLQSKMPIDENSAENISKTKTKYEIATCDVTFNNLPFIYSLIKATVSLWKQNEPISNDESKQFSICLSLLLLIAASRRKLSNRTGCAAIYLSWNDLRNEIGKRCDISFPKDVISIIAKIEEGWTSESFEQFLKAYIWRWRNGSIVKPFEDESDAVNYVQRMELSTSEESEDVEMKDANKDDDEEEEKKEIVESPVEITSNVLESVNALFDFLSNGDTDESNKIFNISNIFNGLNWTSVEKSRMMRTIAVLCATLVNSKLLSQAEEGTDFIVGDLASIGGGAHCLATRLFFSAIAYNPTLSNLSVSHLQKFPIREISRKLWRLALNSGRLKTRIREHIKQVSCGIKEWRDDNENVDCVEVGVEMMRNAVPPPNTLDPVIFEEEQIQFIRAKRRILLKQLDILSTYRQLVSRQERDCDSATTHPILKAAREIEAELKCLDEKLTEGGDDDAIRARQIHRQSATQYATLCAELASFFNVTLDAIRDSRKIEESRATDEQLRIKLARMKSFIISASNFRVSILRKYSSFVDVATPFIAGLMLVEIALNESVLNASRVLKRHDAEISTNFPRMINITSSNNGLVSPEVLTWAIRDSSPMPLLLKAAVVRKRLAECCAMELQADIQWVRNQWKKWYERNIAQAEKKDFVYRSKSEEEKEQLDIEEYFSASSHDSHVLSENDVSLLLEAVEKTSKSLVDENSRNASDARHKMALSWMRYVLSEVGLIPDDQLVDIRCIDGDQKLFEILANNEGLNDGLEGEDKKIINVYSNSSLRECRRVASILERLAARVGDVRERWPEVVSLKSILTAIDEFFGVSVAMPHIKMAAEIEKLIEQCEQWESMADRQNSLKGPLDELRRLLVEWKKMEVRCWSALLDNCQNEARQRAQLVAFPLFESLFTADSIEAETSIVAMSIEWMHNSTLIDFGTRVRSVESLSKWATIIGKMELSAKLLSASRHFEMFVESVEKRLKAAREPAERSLSDYLKVVKYNDLNLWNIRVSSQKAHAQLYKIVRRFKAAINEEVDADFEVLQTLAEWRNKAIDDREESRIEDIEDVEIRKRIRQSMKFCDEVSAKTTLMCNVTAIEELAEQTKSTDESIRTMINYVGEDSEKEKQQGYARNARQRQVAMVIKEAQSIGLNARRAALLTQERINEMSVIGIETSGECETSVRVCAAGRNVVIKKANKIDQQVGVSTRKHLTGIIEYGMDYMIKMHGNLNKWTNDAGRIEKAIDEMKRIVENQKVSWNIDHEIVAGRVENISKLISDVSIIVEIVMRRLNEIPENVDDEFAKEHHHPLARICKSDEMAKKLMSCLKRIEISLSNLKRTNDEINENDGKIIENAKFEYWKREMKSYVEEAIGEFETFDGFFDVESIEMKRLLFLIQADVDKLLPLEEPTRKEINVARVLMVIQNIYKGLENAEIDDTVALDKIISVANCLNASDMGSLVIWLEEMIEEHRSGRVVRQGMRGVVELTKTAVHMLNECIARLTNCLGKFCVLYHAILSMTIQLFEHGYVNTIPKADKQESGDGETDASGEGGGIGEGGTAKDAKDVTDEMEETGQIEGLEDEQPVDSEEHEAKNENEKPIEMEDDFAEDLQDIDKTEKGDENDENDQSDEETPEPEDQIGDVDDEDEKQLDPDMWDNDEKEENDAKNMDQEQDGADKETNEMVAKEDNADQKNDEGDEKKDENVRICIYV